MEFALFIGRSKAWRQVHVSQKTGQQQAETERPEAIYTSYGEMESQPLVRGLQRRFVSSGNSQVGGRPVLLVSGPENRLAVPLMRHRGGLRIEEDGSRYGGARHRLRRNPRTKSSEIEGRKCFWRVPLCRVFFSVQPGEPPNQRCNHSSAFP